MHVRVGSAQRRVWCSRRAGHDQVVQAVSGRSCHLSHEVAEVQPGDVGKVNQDPESEGLKPLFLTAGSVLT